MVYNLANKGAKSVMSEARFKAYDTLYAKLGSKEREIFIGQLRVKKGKGGIQGVLGVVKDDDIKVLLQDDEIKEI